MQRGIVKFFNDVRGFGFIAQDNGGPDVFVHYSAIEGRGRKTLIENQAVEYSCEQGAKGLQATKVVSLTQTG